MTKALLQSGVAYVGGYQGAPISHLMDVLGDAQEILEELDVYFENSASEATAAAMLAASVHYPLRGAVTFKSTVGLNVAVRRPGQPGLAAGSTAARLIILGEDYGEGSSDHAGALARLRDEVADVAARPAARTSARSSTRSKPASSSPRPATRR